MTSIKESDAQQLFRNVVANDVLGVERLLGGGNSVTWREIIRYELSLASMLDTTQSLAALKVLHKLMAYEIITMSAFHAAAMMGHNDILVVLLDKDIPVDLALSSGTTAAHLASFAGELDTLKLLKDVYKAEINKQDKYGWSCLHYACTEGHKHIVQYLQEVGIDLYLRDKDGTTGAFRAEANKHTELVKYLCQFGDEDTLLNVSEEQPDTSIDDLYSKPQKKPAKPPKLCPRTKSTPTGSQFDVDGTLYDFAGAPPPLARRNSTPEGANGNHTQFKSKTLPSRKSITRTSTGKNTIRRMIRNELENVFAGDYMEPAELRKQQKALKDPRISDVSLTELKAVMREELERFKSEAGFQSPTASISSEQELFGDSDNNNDYEDLYATLKALPRAPSPPAPGAPGPPLPPRNDTLKPGTQTLALRALDQAIDEFDVGTVKLQRPVPNAALSESFKRLAPKLGDNWRKLARALPIASSQSKVSQRIKEIEDQYPDSREKQAAMVLGEWRMNAGTQADVDALIIALRKCHLEDIIPDVEKVTQEFTA